MHETLACVRKCVCAITLGSHWLMLGASRRRIHPMWFVTLWNQGAYQITHRLQAVAVEY